MSESAEEQRYYVYTLAYPDGRVFYVGKGTGKRKDMHVREARRGGSEPRHAAIREIEAAGEQVVVQVRESGLVESSALLLERTYLEIFESDLLTNVNGRIPRAIPTVPVAHPSPAPSPSRLPVTDNTILPLAARRQPFARLMRERLLRPTPTDATTGQQPTPLPEATSFTHDPNPMPDLHSDMRTVSARLAPILERVRARLAASPDPADREMVARVFDDTTHPQRG